jgi:ELWxxDGT repeat protein
VIFSAHTAAHGRELWRTDGVTASLVVDAAPGPASGWRRSLGVGFGQVFFAADDGVHGEELWALDLVTGNAALLADLRSGPASSYPYAVCALADGLLVMVAQQTAVSALHWLPWDGQQLGAPPLLHQGTFGLSALNPSFTPMGRGAYFSAPYGTTGHEVWYVEPGVSAPALVCDLWPGSGHSFPDSLRTIDDRLMFRASDPVHGYELRTLHTGQATAQTIDPPAAYTSLSVTPPVLGKTMRIEHLGGLPGAPTANVFGPPRDEPLVTALGALAWLAPSQATVLTTGAGPVIQRQVVVPANPALMGVRLHVQAYSVPGHTSPFDLSNAVRIVLGN